MEGAAKVVYSLGSLLGNTKVCLSGNMLWVLQRGTGLLNIRAEPEAMTLPEIKLQLVIEQERGAPLSSDPIRVARKWKKVLPIFPLNKWRSSRNAETPPPPPRQLRDHHGTTSFVTGFMHPSKTHMHVMIAFTPKEGPHSPHSSLVSTLLEEGRTRQRRKQEKRREKDDFNVKDRWRLQLGFLQA